MKTRLDSPYRKDAEGRWQLSLEAGRVVEWGHAFDRKRGWRVFLGFKDSYGKNTISAASARLIADDIGDATPDTIHLASKLRDMGDQVDRLQAAWIAAGRPSEPMTADSPAADGPDMPLAIRCLDPALPIPRDVVYALACDGDHGFLPPAEETFPSYDAACAAGWKETFAAGSRLFLGPCCSGKAVLSSRDGG